MVKSKALWKTGILSFVIVLVLWMLKAVGTITETGIFYSVLTPLGIILLMVVVYLIILGAGQAFFHNSQGLRPISPLLTGVLAYVLLAPLAIVAQWMEYFPEDTSSTVLWAMAGIGVWVVLMWLFNFALTKIVPTIQPATAKRAARSLFAEKNFWYMFASPSNKNIVGRNKANAACGPRAPKSDT